MFVCFYGTADLQNNGIITVKSFKEAPCGSGWEKGSFSQATATEQHSQDSQMTQRSQVDGSSPFVCMDNWGEQMSKGFTSNPSLSSSQWSWKNTTMGQVQQFMLLNYFHGLQRNVYIDFLGGRTCSIRRFFKLNYNLQFRKGSKQTVTEGVVPKNYGSFFTYKRGSRPDFIFIGYYEFTVCQYL